MINKFHHISMAVGFLLLSGYSTTIQANQELNCEGLKACKQKICNLKNDIYTAKKANNSNRVDGLTISLSKVQKHCTDDGMIEKIKEKIRDAKKDLKEDIHDYEEAIKDERADKVKKYKNRMAEEKLEIKLLEKELKELI